jgi:hypothetical protein
VMKVVPTEIKPVEIVNPIAATFGHSPGTAKARKLKIWLYDMEYNRIDIKDKKERKIMPFKVTNNVTKGLFFRKPADRSYKTKALTKVRFAKQKTKTILIDSSLQTLGYKTVFRKAIVICENLHKKFGINYSYFHNWLTSNYLSSDSERINKNFRKIMDKFKSFIRRFENPFKHRKYFRSLTKTLKKIIRKRNIKIGIHRFEPFKVSKRSKLYLDDASGKSDSGLILECPGLRFLVCIKLTDGLYQLKSL